MIRFKYEFKTITHIAGSYSLIEWLKCCDQAKYHQPPQQIRSNKIKKISFKVYPATAKARS